MFRELFGWGPASQGHDGSGEAGSRRLGDVPANQRGVVQRLQGGKDFVSRMAALGFVTGAEVLVLQNYGRGPLIARVGETRVALGRGEALKVIVMEGRSERVPGDAGDGPARA